MGFFSWNCGACNKPVVNIYAAGADYPQAAQVAVFTRSGKVIKDAYDGYGGVGPLDLIELDEENWRIAHQMCSEGQSFATLKAPKHDAYQGFFLGDDDMRKYFGPPAGKAVT